MSTNTNDNAGIQELREQRAAVVARIETLRDKVNDDALTWEDADESEWLDLNSRFESVNRRIEINDRTEELHRSADQRDRESAERRGEPAERSDRERYRASRGLVTEELRCNALAAWALHSLDTPDDEIRSEYVAAADRIGLDWRSDRIDYRLPIDYSTVRDCAMARLNGEARANMTTSTDAEIIPEGFVRSLEVALLQFGAVRQISRVVRTANGADLPWPTIDDTSNKGELVTEGGSVAEQEAAASAVVFKAYKMGSKLIKVSAELIQDSAFNLAEMLGRIAGERIGRISEQYYVTGTGSSQPTGIATAAATGTTAAAVGAVTTAELIDLKFSIDPAYEQPTNVFLMNNSTRAAVMKLLDDDSRPIWQPNLQSDTPNLLLGQRVAISPEVATMAASAKAIYYGDFSKFVIRDVAGIRMRRLTERYAENDLEGFVAFLRTDSNELDAGTNPIKVLVNAAS